MDWQKNLGRESIYFALTILTSLLFWIAIASIIEQNIIASEYLYARERNGFMLTVGVFYFIRLNAWMINRNGAYEDRKWEPGDRNVRKKESAELHMVGEAKEQCGKLLARVKHEWTADNDPHKANEDGSIC